MTLFFGDIGQLEELVKTAGYVGSWQYKKANDCHSFKARTGEVLNWWPAKGTLQFQGKNVQAAKDKILPLLDESASATPPVENLTDKKIFIVHGHDDDATEQLELIIRRLGLEPFIIQSTDASSQTLIEALEKNIDKETALGIVLLTPDDFGYPKSKQEPDKQPRARQNVILEMGMVMGRLGRERTFILKKGALEIPSDINGIQYHEFNEHVQEVTKRLVQRLGQLGFKIDQSKITAALG